MCVFVLRNEDISEVLDMYWARFRGQAECLNVDSNGFILRRVDIGLKVKYGPVVSDAMRILRGRQGANVQAYGIHAIFSFKVIHQLDPIEIRSYRFLFEVRKPEQVFLTTVDKNHPRKTWRHTRDVSLETDSSSQRPSTSETAAPHNHSG